MTTASDSRPPAFHVMAKPRGAICNLGCEYCYYLPKKALYPDSTFRMSNQVLKSYVRQYIAAQQVPQIHFAWQGGEPTLMGLDFFRRVVGYQKEAARPGMRIENAIQTNGTLLNDDWCRFFAENHFLVGISLDGPREIH
ncbi:MAG TPA: radical SAM protein, partial [Flexilinea sp.]|nr:radical SAM protein [Flexilinea sp.]